MEEDRKEKGNFAPWRRETWRLSCWLGQLLTLPLHAGGQALLIAAVLTAVPLALVHRAIFVIAAGVGQVLPDGAFEETLAALAAVHTIVLAYRGRSVAGKTSEDTCPQGIQG